MKTNIPLISSLRKPFRSLLLLILIVLISFGFMTKAVEYILVQSQTEALGSYYRSIGMLQNTKDPQAGDISAGIALIQTSPYFAYGDQRELVSGVMAQTYNENFGWANFPEAYVYSSYPKEWWPNTHNTDIWFTGDLIHEEDALDSNNEMGGYYLKFNIDTVLAAYPEYATQGKSIGFLFISEGNEAAIPLIQEMVVGQRYLIHGWYNLSLESDSVWRLAAYDYLQIKPLDDDGQLWYIPLDEGAGIDFSDPAMVSIKDQIDVLNENLHALSIIATADMSAMPQMQETSRKYYLTAGRWLNHQDDRSGNKVIVVSQEFADLASLQLGDEITLTFRPLTDTYAGLIRDGVDTLNWRSYPTYQDKFTIVGLYASTNNFAMYAYIPTSSLRPGFTSTTQSQFNKENEFSFVLNSSRNETRFIQENKAPLQALGINLTFLPNNGQAYWDAVDPIRRSLSADLLVFGLLMAVALILAVFLYVMARKRDYAILRALGVPARQANGQLVLPLLLLGGLGIITGGSSSWNYAISQAKDSLSSLPLPAGVSPSADLSLFILLGLCAVMFLLLALLTWLGVLLLSRKPVYELLQGETSQNTGAQKPVRASASDQPMPSSSSSLASTVGKNESELQEQPASKVDPALQRKYTPASLSRYVLHHMLRSRLRSCLTLAVALGFMLASGWIRQTIERSQMEVDALYDTTVVQADILPADSSTGSSGETSGVRQGFVSLQTIQSVLDSGFVGGSVLEADIVWSTITKLDSQDAIAGNIQVYAYDGPEAFQSGLADPGSLVFAPGWDLNLFAGARTLEQIRADGVPVLFPASLLEQLGLNVGEKIRITDQANITHACIIVGQYSGMIGSTINSIYTPRGYGYILVPLSALESIEGNYIKFTVAHFNLDPKKNRELAQLRTDMEKVMGIYGGRLRFVIWDEELRLVIAQLEKNLSLLKVLYPVVMAVSVLIGAGLCFLLLLQATREAAILRVLGTTRAAVRLALITEPLILSVIGVLFGLGISRLLGMTSDLGSAVPLLTGAGLYLAGVLAGSVAGAISVTNKKPIELLQVKE